MKRAFYKLRTPMSKAPTGTKRVHRSPLKRKRQRKKSDKADDGIRTRDLRFTKPLLYQLSYVGAARQRLHPETSDTSTAEKALPSRVWMRASRVSQRRGYRGEYECLADFAKGDPLRCLFKCCLEPFDWFAQWLETEAESLM